MTAAPVRGDDVPVAPSVLIVDDHTPFRVLARQLLEHDGFDVVGEAVDGLSAIEASRRLRPSIVLLDIQLPDADGFTVAGALARLDRPPLVVLTSTRDRSAFHSRLAEPGAPPFLNKADLTGAAVAALIG
jgi:DNA-binding NarL/FixJ family response regulator